MDEAERMDLALNSHFDSALLDCWDDDRELGGESKVGAVGRGGSLSETNQTFRADSWGTSDRLDRFARLPSFNMDQDDDSQGSRSSEVSGDESADPAATWVGTASRRDSGSRGATGTTVAQAVVSANQSTTSGNARQADAFQLNASQLTGLIQGLPEFHNAMQLHPLAIQATANCPPHESATTAATATDLQNSLLPLAMNAMAAGATLSHPAFLAQAAAVASASAAAASQRQHSQHQPLAPKGLLALKTTAAAQPPTASITSNVNPNAPPFMLFDAPIELRTNFEHAQRALGIPVLYDNNSYHFGFAVNGFHPQGCTGQDPNVRLVDARHGDAGDKRIKNAKEQRRAQKIAELIDELRDKMENDGWKVGIKSKYNTLACCADYIKHLVKVTNEKELVVKQVRCNLEAKKQRMDDDKVQQDPSEPESTTSSLTVSSSSGDSGKAKAKSSETEPADFDVGSKSDHNAALAQRKMRLWAHASNVSSTTSAGTSSSGIDDAKMSSVSCDQGSASVSDLGESNDGTPRRRSTRTRKGTSHTEVTASSSDVNVEGIRKEYEKVLSKKRKRNGSLDPTSLDPDFQLDYEEVFVKSCVPQIIASTAGRIVAWNEFFLKAAGLSEDEVDKTTIFSLVQKDKLSTLFDIVAKSLRLEDPDPTVDAEKTPSDYSAVTLPCLNLPSGGPQLFLTVTLMRDSDLRKRCFHCILTDSPCTDGELGPVTPELLKMLFTASRGTNRHKRSKGSSSRDAKVSS